MRWRDLVIVLTAVSVLSWLFSGPPARPVERPSPPTGDRSPTPELAEEHLQVHLSIKGQGARFEDLVFVVQVTNPPAARSEEFLHEGQLRIELICSDGCVSLRPKGERQIWLRPGASVSWPLPVKLMDHFSPVRVRGFRAYARLIDRWSPGGRTQVPVWESETETVEVRLQ